MGNYAEPVQELIARLNYHVAQAGRILFGVRFVPIPTVEVDGQKDLPGLRLYPPSLTEKYRPSGRMSSGLADPSMTIELRLSTARKDGIPSHWEWVEKVLDAIETDTSGKINTDLKSTKPFGAVVLPDLTLDLTLTARITVSVTPKPTQRGIRRN
jgi:hypothetical protein